MGQIRGIGGVFVKTPDREKLRNWYREVLGFEFRKFGGAAFAPDMLAGVRESGTIFTGFSEDSDCFEPPERDFIVNFIVHDLDGLLARCEKHGVEPVE